MALYSTDYVGIYTDTNSGELVAFGPFVSREEFEEWHANRRADSPNTFVALVPWRFANHDLLVNLP